MCTYVIAKNAHSDWPLIIAGNRDESLSRPSQTLSEWPGMNLFAGKDLKKGGTWLGMRRDGRFGLVSNFRSLSHSINHADNNFSRGILLRDLLIADVSIAEHMPTLQQQAARCQGFNLFFGEVLPRVNLYYYSNANDKCQEINDGVYAFANNLFTDSAWAKASRLQKFTEELLANTVLDEQMLVSELLKILKDSSLCDDVDVPNDTGLPFAVEKQLSAINIKPTKDGFGTRVSTVILVCRDGGVSICERNFNGESKRFDFALSMV